MKRINAYLKLPAICLAVSLAASAVCGHANAQGTETLYSPPHHTTGHGYKGFDERTPVMHKIYRIRAHYPYDSKAAELADQIRPTEIAQLTDYDQSEITWLACRYMDREKIHAIRGKNMDSSLINGLTQDYLEDPEHNVSSKNALEHILPSQIADLSDKSQSSIRWYSYLLLSKEQVGSIRGENLETGLFASLVNLATKEQIKQVLTKFSPDQFTSIDTDEKGRIARKMEGYLPPSLADALNTTPPHRKETPTQHTTTRLDS